MPHGVAIALVLVAGCAGREEVSFNITSEFERAGVALEERADTALPSGEVELADVRLCCSGVWSGVEGRVDVGVERALTEDEFTREEGNRRNRHTLVPKGKGRFDLFVEVLLGVADGLGETGRLRKP